MTIIGGIIAVLALIISFAIQNQVKKDTGVWVSRSNLRYIRRQSRLKGIPEEQAYSEWMERKQKRLGVGPEPAADVPLETPPARFGPVRIIAIIFLISGVAWIIWKAAVDSKQSPAPQTVTVDRERVNCRLSPTQDSVVIEKLDRGQVLTVASVALRWTKVDQPSCWVRTDLLKASS